MPLSPDQLRQCRAVADLMTSARSVVAFTGAGISTESGIPDFRSPGGVWATSKPVLYQDFLCSAAARQEAWRQKAVAFREFRDCGPNQGHLILADWESRGLLRGLVTQNIDGLHQRAGSRRVLELHGTALEVVCLECGARYPSAPLMDRYGLEQQPPACERCRGMLKHATISFGQPLDDEVWRDSLSLCAMADVLLAIGSSLVVEPAASLPRAAAEADAKLVVINRDPTPLDSRAAVTLHASIGETLAAIDEALDHRVV
ncbi:MAG: Sir2 family NAD-dependent protein deacetylase [Pirellulales bacterium]